MMPLRSEKWAAAPSVSAVSQTALTYLDYLRKVGMRCRPLPRTGLFEACALLQTTHDKTQWAYAEALMRTLNEAIGKRAHLHAPGVSDLSFDELWLLQLGNASASGDDLSLQFLLKSRVAREHRRLVSFLVHHVSRGFPPVPN